jgi:hypothetical protein
MSFAEGDYSATYAIEVDGENVTVRYANEVIKGTFKDGALEFSGNHYIGEAGYEAPLKITGKLEGEQIKGNVTWDAYSGTFVANKAK